MLRLVRSRRFLRAADLGHPWPEHNPLLAELGQTLVHPTTTPPSPTRHTPRRISHVHKECPTITIAFSRHLAPIKTSPSLSCWPTSSRWSAMAASESEVVVSVESRNPRVQDVGRSRKVGSRPSCSCDIRRPGDTATNQLSPTIDTFGLTFPH